MMGQDREERSVAQQPRQDSWDRIVGDRTVGTGHSGQNRKDRTPKDDSKYVTARRGHWGWG